MQDDDAQIGRLLTRREMLALLGAAGVAAAVACSGGDGADPTRSRTPAATGAAGTPPSIATSGSTAGATTPMCVVKPALMEGPFFVDERLNRSDVRSNTATGVMSPGVPLSLTFVVSEVGASCAALPGATVDIWQCDALGRYSDEQDPAFNTKGQNFLRGYQTTDADGRARFTTIYPGWYDGRTIHIHFKIRTPAAGGKVNDFTSQVFFEDALNDTVLKEQPYAQKGPNPLKNAGDSIFRDSNGQLTLSPTRSGDGYTATVALGLQS